MLSEHFSLRELERSQVAARFGIDNAPSFAQVEALRMLAELVLEPVRALAGGPLTITSGYRSPALNLQIGGSPTSQHCARGGACAAADLEAPGVDNLTLARRIEASDIPFDQLILEHYAPPDGGWVHISWRRSAPRRLVLTATRAPGGVAYTRGLPG